jgi:hypothetical protein
LCPVADRWGPAVRLSPTSSPQVSRAHSWPPAVTGRVPRSPAFKPRLHAVVKLALHFPPSIGRFFSLIPPPLNSPSKAAAIHGHAAGNRLPRHPSLYKCPQGLPWPPFNHIRASPPPSPIPVRPIELVVAVVEVWPPAPISAVVDSLAVTPQVFN